MLISCLRGQMEVSVGLRLGRQAGNRGHGPDGPQDHAGPQLGGADAPATDAG